MNTLLSKLFLIMVFCGSGFALANAIPAHNVLFCNMSFPEKIAENINKDIQKELSRVKALNPEVFLKSTSKPTMLSRGSYTEVCVTIDLGLESEGKTK